MKRIIAVMCVIALAASIGTMLAEVVTPANVVLTCIRDAGSSAAVTTTVFYQGDTISLTNSTMYTGAATNTAVQDLTGCSIAITAGQPSNTNVTTAVGAAIVESNGTFTAEFTVPAFNPCYIQVSVSNSAVFTYPLYRVTTQAKLSAE